MPTKELPQLVTEFVDMSKSYLRQETMGRAKLLGRHAGFGLAAAGLGVFAVIFLAVAGMRLLVDVMPGEPSHRVWSGVAYLLGTVALAAVAGIIVWRGSK